MENNLYNNYLFRAIEAYPYQLEEAVEALNYALAYEPNNVKALCLMAKVQYDQLSNYELAKEYYNLAIASDMHNPDIYPDYIRLLTNNGDYTEAEKLIDFALEFKGTKKANVLLAQASLLEAIKAYEKAETVLEEAKIIALNNEFINYVDAEIARVVKKRKTAHNKNRVKEPAEKTEDKPKTSWFQNRLNNLL